jgi:D-alanine-D-alanine ligase
VKITVLHTKDALEPPVDPLLDQLDQALTENGHTPQRTVVDDAVEPVIEQLKSSQPDLVFNLAESFRGKSALESNVAALLNLMDLRYTGSSPAGLILAGDKTLTKTEFRVPSSRPCIAVRSIGHTRLTSRCW